MEKNVDHYLEKPKKKKKLDKYESLAPNKPKAAKNFKIIDDDIDMNSLIPNQEAEILVDLLDPEGPSIADDSMIAEAEMRSKATEKVEAFANNKWIKVDVFENEDGDMVVAEEQKQSTSLFKKRGEKHKSQTTAKEDDNDDLDVPRKAKEAVKSDSDGDISPVRIKPRREAEPKRSSNNGNKNEDMDDIPRRKPNVKREPNSDDDMDDIPRRRPSSQSSANIKREPDADGDLSPVRRSSKHDRSEREKSSRKRSEDRYLSPVRRSSTSSGGKQHPKVKTEKDSSPDRDRDRKSSSNQHHSRHRDDNSRDTSKNDDVEEKEKISLRRNKPTKDDEAKKAKEEELKKKYDVWKKGLVQVKQQEEKINDYVHEMNKPVARHADDKDLEKLLKDQEREDDPMLEYMRKAKEEEEAKKEPNKPPKRVYRGPPAPPNRYNILPGSKWDGVDRSNGFEKKYYESLTARKVRQEEAYKWSVEDM